MKNNPRRNENGSFLIEIVLVAGLASFVLVIIAALGIEVTQRLTKAENALAKGMIAAELRHAISKADVRLRAQRIFPDSSYALVNSVNGASYQKMATTYAGSPVHTFNVAEIRNKEKSAFMDRQIASTGAAPLAVHVNSFLLEEPGFKNDEDVVTKRELLHKTPRSLFVSRCIENVATNFDAKTASTIDVAAPQTSAIYVIDNLKRVPYLVKGTDGRITVRCCPATSGPDCTDGDVVSHWLPMVYIVRFDSTTSQPVAIEEYPRPTDRSLIWGAGFLNTFNQVDNPTHFRLMMFHLQDNCRIKQTALGAECFSGPETVWNGDLNKRPTYVNDFVALYKSSLSGKISTALDSGLIPLD